MGSSHTRAATARRATESLAAHQQHVLLARSEPMEARMNAARSIAESKVLTRAARVATAPRSDDASNASRPSARKTFVQR
jgi:hypothetical protein